jgi:secreted PhoX family phosphatase
MLALPGERNYDASRGQRVGRRLPVTWVDIPRPDPPSAYDTAAVFSQGFSQGAARFTRLEGCWYGDRSIFFHATDGGDAGLGQVWQYRPDGADAGGLTLVFESPSADVLDYPDNITVSPRGGVVICEDGADDQFVRGLTRDGRIFDFARNLVSGDEFAGACFSPDGQTLFVNIMGSTRDAGPSLGQTFAVWGPWEQGAL